MKLNELEGFPELGNTIFIDGIEYVKKREPLSDKEKKSYLDEIDRLGVESNRDEEEIDRLTQLLTSTKQKPVACNELCIDINKLLAQPEQDLEVLKKDWVNFGYTAGRREGYKREAIEDGELEVWYSQHAWAMDKQEYIWGFRDAEKAHGIGGGE